MHGKKLLNFFVDPDGMKALFNPMSFLFPKLQCALLKKFNLTSIVYSIQYTLYLGLYFR